MFRPSFLALLAAASLYLAPAALAAEPVADPFSLPAFSADPAALLAAAKATPPPEDALADVYLHETLIDIDAQGRRNWTLRMVYRPLGAESARKLGITSAVWSPWYEQRPQLDTRVVAADGRVFRLDQATVGEAPIDESAPELFDDRRRVRAPIPGIAEDAVVEEVIVTKEITSFFEAGMTSSTSVGMPGPVRRARVVVTAPEKTPLRWNLRGSTAKPRRTVEHGRVRLELELGRVEPGEEPEPLVPRSYVHVPTFSVSTGESWKSVGAAYGALVDKQLAGAQLKALALEAVDGATGREAIAARLLGWVRQNIRYTGLHFGEAKIVPYPPAETLKRRFGDCKDMSTLLVGLLREAGVPAYVALVRTTGELEAGLPGLGGFNHAIVYVPGKKPLWMDPTDPDGALGSLPQSVQGVRALATGTGADALLQIPAADPKENRLRIVREYRFEEQGGGKVIETREARGIVGAWYRSDRPEDEKERRANLESYAKSIYGSKALDDFEDQPYGDTTDPYRARYVMSGCSRAVTDGTQAVAFISPAPILNLMPDFLMEQDDDGPVERKPGWRKQPLALPCPFVAEMEYRLVPPVGFAAKALPAEVTRHVGGALYTERFATEPDGTVVARYGFETGPGYYSPAQVGELAAALGELASKNDERIEFELKAATLAASGRRREAFAEHLRLIELHPAEARHHDQYANALLEAGLGGAARAEARRGVELEPQSAQAHYALGRVLQHDLLGRWMVPGFDRDGALAAMRKARELDPKLFNAHSAIAYLLEHDARGKRYAAPEGLGPAIAEYQALRALEPDDDDLLLILLAKDGRAAELKEAARRAVETETRNVALVAAVAAVDGVPAAVGEAGKLLPEAKDRRKALAEAVDFLVQMRRYKEAAAMARFAAAGAPDGYALQSRAASLERVKRHEELVLDPKEPAGLVKLFFVKMLLPEVPESEVAALLSKHALKVEGRIKSDARKAFEISARLNGTADVPPTVMVEVAASLMEVGVEGSSENGWRATASFAENARARSEWYLVREDGKLKVLATQEPAVLVGEASRRLERGQIEAARRWLEWAGLEAEPSCAEEDETTTLRRTIARFQANGDDARLAAGAIPVLSTTLACAQGEARERDVEALATAFSAAEKGTALLALAEKEMAADPDRALWAKNRALHLLGRREEETALLRANQERPFARFVLRKLAMDEGDLAAAQELARKHIAEGKGDLADAYNDLAWSAAFAPTVTEQAIDDGRRAVAASGERSRATLHTLATLYAQSGRPDEAIQVLRKSVEVAGGEPDSDDWYVIGRAAEEYGLHDEARRLYGLVEKPKRPHATDTWILAQRRLEALAQQENPK